MNVLLPTAASLLIGVFAFGQDAASPAAAFKVPDEFATKANPVKPTSEGMAHARKMWGYDCAICHGAAGDGKGELAASMKVPIKNYTDPAALQGMSDGELFYILEKGKGEMPLEGDRAKPEDLWNMVALVRSFARK